MSYCYYLLIVANPLALGLPPMMAADGTLSASCNMASSVLLKLLPDFLVLSKWHKCTVCFISV